MAIGIRERAQAYLEAAREVRSIDQESGPEKERLDRIGAILIDLAQTPGIFPVHSFPRTPGTSGGLFRLVEFADGRAPLYMSLGFTGRSQTPHRHISWAIVAGVSGGIEANNLYAFHEASGERAATLEHLAAVAVGPGDAVAIGTGVFHTIDVQSDDPVLHIHAYGVAVDSPGHELPIFDSPNARTYSLRASGGFQPPLALVGPEDVRADLAAGHAALLDVDGTATIDGPHIFGSAQELEDAALPADLPVLVTGDSDTATNIAKALYRAGHPLVFRYAA